MYPVYSALSGRVVFIGDINIIIKSNSIFFICYNLLSRTTSCDNFWPIESAKIIEHQVLVNPHRGFTFFSSDVAPTQ